MLQRKLQISEELDTFLLENGVSIDERYFPQDE